MDNNSVCTRYIVYTDGKAHQVYENACNTCKDLTWVHAFLMILILLLYQWIQNHLLRRFQLVCPFIRLIAIYLFLRLKYRSQFLRCSHNYLSSWLFVRTLLKLGCLDGPFVPLPPFEKNDYIKKKITIFNLSWQQSRRCIRKLWVGSNYFFNLFLYKAFSKSKPLYAKNI